MSNFKKLFKKENINHYQKGKPLVITKNAKRPINALTRLATNDIKSALK